MGENLWAQIVSFFRGKGYSDAQAQGIAGNLYGESGFNPSITGDGGAAYGLAQWHPDRQADFARVFGKSIVGSSFNEQLEFVNWELDNKPYLGKAKLKATTTVAEATQTFMNLFERPADGSSYGSRLNAALGNIGGIASNLLNPLGGITGMLPDSVTDLDPTGISGFLRDFFSGAMAARFSAVIVGIILIALAIAAFMFMSDAGKAVIKTVAKV